MPERQILNLSLTRNRELFSVREKLIRTPRRLKSLCNNFFINFCLHIPYVTTSLNMREKGKFFKKLNWNKDCKIFRRKIGEFFKENKI